MKVKDMHNKEVELLKAKVKRTAKLCQVIFEYHDYIVLIKEALERDDEPEASALFNELDFHTQELLLTAPLYGGAFTTQERERVKNLWEVSSEDIQNYLQRS